jgi:hypothetical protein
MTAYDNPKPHKIEITLLLLLPLLLLLLLLFHPFSNTIEKIKEAHNVKFSGSL